MDELKKIKEDLRKEKAKFEVEKAMEERTAKKKKIEKELREYKRKNNPLIKAGKSLGHTLDVIDTNRMKANYGIDVGSVVIISKGDYIGKKIKITSFIPGGIRGDCEGKILNIRYGSFVK